MDQKPLPIQRAAIEKQLPRLLAESERFSREFFRQQKALSALALRCGEAARLLRLGHYLCEVLSAALQELDRGKAAGFLLNLSFLTADFKYQRLEQIQALGQKLQEELLPFCSRAEALGLSVQIDAAVEIEGLKDDVGRMMACLGISNTALSAEDEIARVRTCWQGAQRLLEAALSELKTFHTQQLELLECKQHAFVRLLQWEGDAVP